MPFTEPSQIGDLYFAFLAILFEGAPYILLGTIISGFIDAYLPSNIMDRFLPKNRYAAIALSGLLGAIFPVCECAIVPVIRRLVQKGLPVSCAITYMLSAPIVNPIVAVSTFSAFGGEFHDIHAGDALNLTLSRIGFAYLITVFVGIAVHQFSIKSNEYHARLDSEFQSVEGRDNDAHISFRGAAAEVQEDAYSYEVIPTGISIEEIRELGRKLVKIPDDFSINAKIEKLFLARRAKATEEGGPYDWAYAEALAFASLLDSGYPVRLSGQDVRRGTFSQRHCVLYDSQNRERYVPLKNLSSNQASFCAYNSLLSEAGVLGFDYGYREKLLHKLL